MRLSVVVPAYNEEATIARAVERLLKVDLPCDSEILVVDDASTDATSEAVARMSDSRLKLIRHSSNAGKTAAVATGARVATGDYLLIQDADEEYDPEDIPRLLEPVIAGRAKVVYGVRGFGSHNSYSFVYVMGNKLVTLAVNVLFNAYLSDVETCYKLIPLPLFRSLRVRSRRFGLEAEVTAKLLRRHHRIYEVPISYTARSRAEGKKLKARDGLQALAIVLAVRILGEPLAPGRARQPALGGEAPT